LKDDTYKIIFSHHSLANEFMNRGVSNRKEIRKLLEENNVNKKILLCMNGHDHGTDVKRINDIIYYTVNSASYIWHGKKYRKFYPDDVYKQYPFLEDVLLYKNPLRVVLNIDEKYNIHIEGMKGNYSNLKPEDIGLGKTWNGVSIEAQTISFDIRASNAGEF